jgi:hypothetical protein
MAPESSERNWSRREMVQRLLAGLAAGMFPPAFAAGQVTLTQLLCSDALNAADERRIPSNGYQPVFFSAEQFAAADQLCEAIIPGSHQARSADFLDLLLSVEPAEHQKTFAAALAAMDAEAEQAFHKKIGALEPVELRQLLEKMSSKRSADYPHFEKVKHLAVGAYYSSEMGMRELGWTPDRVFASYPVCEHEERHS